MFCFVLFSDVTKPLNQHHLIFSGTPLITLELVPVEPGTLLVMEHFMRPLRLSWLTCTRNRLLWSSLPAMWPMTPLSPPWAPSSLGASSTLMRGAFMRVEVHKKKRKKKLTFFLFSLSLSHSNHASMIQGMKHSGAQKKVFRHNDIEHLEQVLFSPFVWCFYFILLFC